MRPIIRKRLGQTLVWLAVFGFIWAITVPLPYVIAAPGPTFNVLGQSDGKDVIEVAATEVEQSVGVLDLTTVSTYGSPESTPSLTELIFAFFSSDRIILPLDSVYPLGKTGEETDSEQKDLFRATEHDAVQAAMNELGLSKTPTVSFHLDDVGGPSGGLIFALGLIDKLTPGQLTGGKSIAGTGTITPDGTVGEIGGIRLKMLAAKRAGDQFFLAPSFNCSDVVGFEPAGLRVIPVATLSDALKALNVIAVDGDLSGFPVCAVK